MSKTKENIRKNLQTVLDNPQLCEAMTFAQRSAIRVAIAMIENNGWIPTTEALPQEWYHPGDDTHAGEYIPFNVFIEGAILPTTLFFSGAEFFDFDDFAVQNVTHWQPLPRSPKEL